MSGDKEKGTLLVSREAPRLAKILAKSLLRRKERPGIHWREMDRLGPRKSGQRPLYVFQIVCVCVCTCVEDKVVRIDCESDRRFTDSKSQLDW